MDQKAGLLSKLHQFSSSLILGLLLSSAFSFAHADPLQPPSADFRDPSTRLERTCWNQIYWVVEQEIALLSSGLEPYYLGQALEQNRLALNAVHDRCNNRRASQIIYRANSEKKREGVLDRFSDRLLYYEHSIRESLLSGCETCNGVERVE